MKHTTVPVLGIALLALTVSACASMGGILGGRPDEIDGEVRSLDTRRGQLQIREDYGRDISVRYDGRTRVVSGGRSYGVSSLRRGDQVRVHLDYDRNDQPWAERIELRRESRSGGVWQDRDRRARVERWDGVVQQVDHRRGWFTLDRGRSGDVRVYLGRNPRREDVRDFERLRRGQRVRIEVYASSRGQAELVRFR